MEFTPQFKIGDVVCPKYASLYSMTVKEINSILLDEQDVPVYLCLTGTVPINTYMTFLERELMQYIEKGLQFKRGDVVCLKSNTALPMTISSASEYGHCTCQWTDRDGKPQTHNYNNEQLIMYDPKFDTSGSLLDDMHTEKITPYYANH